MKVEITSPVEHDGKALDVGAKVDLPTEAAEALVQAGAAVVAGKKPADADKAGE